MPLHRNDAANDTPRLAPDLLYLLEQLPRERWPAEAAHGTAGVWLSMHASLRHGQQRLETLAQRWLSKDTDWVGFRQEAVPLLDAHLGHLHGHHRLEDQHYFPVMRHAEPRLATGFDLLDSDHQAIDQSVQALHRLQLQLVRANPAEAAAWQCAHDLVRELPVCGRLLNRHLADEEDLVIPLLALRESRQRAA
ncbi:hemerythrin domain-containing protein [Acidovorax sp.]|uniref:hemerythrin domain-containing protein n=1 Tax=Acidovorax sp. TaxID=1872122 RepID=UPI00260FE3FD|nr:hemerythrin domain-containing protein [Acidovorax sp.]